MAGGIASDRGPGIQVGPISSLGEGLQITPAIADLQDAFRSGFLTVDDFTRRLQQGRLANDAEKTQLQAGDFQRRLAPGAFQNAQMAQGLQANQIVAAGQVLPGATDVTLGGQKAALDAQRHEAAGNSENEATRLAEDEFRETRKYEQNNGHAAPKSIDIAAPENAESFSVWFNREKGKEIEKIADGFEGISQDDAEKRVEKDISSFKSNFPLNSPQDNQARAAFENQQRQKLRDLQDRRDAHVSEAWKNMVESSHVQEEYQKHLKEITTRTVKPGEPEYLAEIKRRNLLTEQNAAVTAAKVKALPGVLEAQAKSQAEAPGKEKQAAAALQKEYGTRQEIQDLRKVQAAYYKLDRLLDPSVPPTAARDQGAVFSWMKILDPGSTVREGEYATAKNARGVPDKISALYNQVLTGQILTPAQRVSFKEAVEPVYLGQVQAAAPTIKQFLSQEGNAVGEVVPPEDAALLQRLSPSAPAGRTPPPGVASRVTQNGAVFQWVGPGPKDYVPVQ